MVAIILVSANILFSWLNGPIRKNVLQAQHTNKAKTSNVKHKHRVSFLTP